MGKPEGPIEHVKSAISVSLLIFSLVLVCGLIGLRQTKISSEVHPAVAYIAFIGSISWLTMVEGGQGSLVGLQPVNRELYKDSHKHAYKCSELCHDGDSLDRYLLGRQFMVVLVVFTVNMSAAPLADADIWGLPKVIQDIFLSTGVAMILITCMVGQLNSQVNASFHMLDYLNNYFGLFTAYVAMFIEFSGLLHASYVVQLVVSLLAGKKIESKDEPRSGAASAFFWFRCLLSLAALAFCIAVTFEALFSGQTTMWEGVPPGLAVVIFLILMSIVGMLEGMQIAFFAVAKLRPCDRGESVFALKTCHLLFGGGGNNLPGFMIGRQLTVVSCMFFVARVTSVSVPEGKTPIFNASGGLLSLFETGLLGALLMTILGSISWQLVASAFPIAFLSNPVTYVLLRFALFLEATGICNGAWVIAAVHKKISGFKRDEVYIGTAEERAAQNNADSKDINVGPGHMTKLPGFIDNAPKSLRKLLTKDQTVVQYLNTVAKEIEDNASERGSTNGSINGENA